MAKTISILAFIFLFIFDCEAQLCGECQTDYFIEDNYPRYWEDPDGILYAVNQIQQPDKLGLWTYFKVLEDNSHELISTRNVTCLELLDGRARQENLDDINIYPNPTSQFLNIEQPYKECLLEFRDIKGILLFSQTASGQKVTKVDISNLQGGMYIINLIAGKQRINKLFVVE